MSIFSEKFSVSTQSKNRQLMNKSGKGPVNGNTFEIPRVAGN